MNDSLIITYDHCMPDVPSLIVARKDRHDITMINKIQGDEAFDIYHYLINRCSLINKKDIPMNVICDGDDESDYVYCPNCRELIGSNEFVWEDFYDRDWEPMYCKECGQAMIWEKR